MKTRSLCSADGSLGNETTVYLPSITARIYHFNSKESCGSDFESKELCAQTEKHMADTAAA